MNDDINELILKQMIAGESEFELNVEKEKEVKSRRKKDYTSTFLTISKLQDRHGVYISMVNYERISTFIRLLGNGVTIGGFVDNVLNTHFEQFQKEISEIINNKISNFKL